MPRVRALRFHWFSHRMAWGWGAVQSSAKANHPVWKLKIDAERSTFTGIPHTSAPLTFLIWETALVHFDSLLAFFDSSDQKIQTFTNIFTASDDELM